MVLLKNQKKKKGFLDTSHTLSLPPQRFGHLISCFMDVNEFQKAAAKFAAKDRKHPEYELVEWAMGVASEGGEFADHVKKHFFHGHPMTPELHDKMIKELGDVLWYVANASRVLGVELTEVMQRNIDKLTARYGDKFSVEKSLNRKDS